MEFCVLSGQILVSLLIEKFLVIDLSVSNSYILYGLQRLKKENDGDIWKINIEHRILDFFSASERLGEEMKVPDVELINEFEHQYYGFSPAGFTDTGRFSKEVVKKKECMVDITGMIFQSKAIKLAFDTFTDRVLTYVFRIPRHITLPEHESTFRLLLTQDPGVLKLDELGRRNDKLEKLIVEYRFTLENIRREIRDASDGIEVLTTLIKQLERLPVVVGDNSKDQSPMDEVSPPSTEVDESMS
ncbi:hypothetical protein KIN20_029865 [Parelaphostrongylus tenuis]|uniref:Uncharacterized protein n=1 Tax=Parelaphostrongylus tenuis TaxID=148309 RepID=A0AAD5WGE7_PARTN|nr:hypothetical protein KIN20_029865 [Parelaphostrongylus tenuis]